MPAPQRSFARAIAAGATIADGVETVVGTTPPASTSFPGCVFLIEFTGVYVLGGDATELVLQIRQTSIAGDSVVPNLAIRTLDALSLQGGFAMRAVDQRAIDAANIVWVLTATPAGDTADISGVVASVTIDVGGSPSTFTD